ncbi:hypothetical protein EDB81DRAFT_934753 [Dactylonectria macrodidyma]|uniref:NAD(P)-binding domain-containing protein n=1 Tax=Dactylonectria macrodidyma TaxID=307937 RepID=A0A9P9ERZ1_9HYPO|nr:hypothetical protein EDB81DRAFT_934753 [Dactylonectria macrodidyma]
MAGSNILVFGGTGPAGICLLRELLFRGHGVIVFARNPSKVPGDLRPNPLLEVVKGELTDRDALSTAISQSSTILSLLGPNTLWYIDTTIYTNFYKSVFNLMRQHGVRRIFAMSTLSVWQPEDTFALTRWLLVTLVFFVAHFGWRTARAMARVFEESAEGLDWTVFRIAGIPGASDEKTWKEDREDGDSFEGWIGQTGWSTHQKRAALARWLVDAAEDGKTRWIGKMPAVSRFAKSGRKTA